MHNNTEKEDGNSSPTYRGGGILAYFLMKHKHLLSKIWTMVLSFLLSISVLSPYANATNSTPDVSGAFDENLEEELEGIYESESGYGWDQASLDAYNYSLELEDGVMQYTRQAGYQWEYLQGDYDVQGNYQPGIINTTRQYLNLPMMGAGIGSGLTIIAMAESQLGTPEQPLGSNNVDYNTWFYGYSVSGEDYPWCCVFVDWCAEQCGYYGSIIPTGIASCTEMRRQLITNFGYECFRTRDTTPMGGSSYTPVPGDLIFFTSSYGADYDHIGFVYQISDDCITTIEGNYGNQVSMVERKKTAGSYVLDGCIIHVPYPESSNQSDEIFAYLTAPNGLNYDPLVAVAILGNMEMESHCTPNTMEIGYTWETGGGFGLIQWTNTDGNTRTTYEGEYYSSEMSYSAQSGLRRTNLVNYCVTHGLNYKDVYGQLEFMDYEIQTTPSYRNAVQAMSSCDHTRDGAAQACLIWLQYVEGLPRTSEYWTTNAFYRSSYTRAMYSKYIG